MTDIIIGSRRIQEVCLFRFQRIKPTLASRLIGVWQDYIVPALLLLGMSVCFAIVILGV